MRLRHVFTLLGLACAALLLLGFIHWAGMPEPWYSSPSAPRAFAREEFARWTASAPVPRVDLARAGAMPEITRIAAGKGRFVVTVAGTSRDAEPIPGSFEPRLAGSGYDLALRGGAQITLVASCRFTPDRRGPWRAIGSSAEVDAALAAALGEPPTQGRREPGFGFALRLDGGPVRVHGAQLFDRECGVRLSGSSAWQQRGGYVVFAVNALVADRAALSLVVPLAHGEPNTASVALEPGASTMFGSAVRAELLGVWPGAAQSWSHTHDRFELGFETRPGDHRHLAVVQYWPADAFVYLQYRSAGAAHWSDIHRPYGIADLDGLSADAALELRHFPEGSLVRFDLPPLAELPAVDNLFGARIDWLRAADPPALARQLRNLVRAESSSGDLSAIVLQSFPFERRDVTVTELVSEVLGDDVGFDPREFRFVQPRPTLGAAAIAAVRRALW